MRRRINREKRETGRSERFDVFTRFQVVSVCSPDAGVVACRNPCLRRGQNLGRGPLGAGEFADGLLREDGLQIAVF
jgi:hypothetical protein